MLRRLKISDYVTGFIGLSIIAASLWSLLAASAGLVVSRARLGEIPLTVFRSAENGPRPAVVIAHGFAGSQQLMHPLAVTLARDGYIAITFDFAGHGRNATPMTGGIKDMAQSTRHLLSEIETVVQHARGLDGSNGAVALAGHSMASELVVQYAMQTPGIEATIALSLFGKAVTADRPRNLLVITGAWEPGVLQEAGWRIVRLAASGDALERVTYGDFAAGTARRLVLAAGAEHIGVLYNRDTQQEAASWMNAVFSRPSGAPVDTRGKWLGLLVLGLVLVARPALALLPRVSIAPSSTANAGWRAFLPAAILPAVATPLLLWKAPTDFLPILLGDYLAVHFAVYGLLTVLALAFVRRNFPGSRAPSVQSWKALLTASACIGLGQIVLFGWPVDHFITSFAPVGMRWPIILAMFASTAIFFAADAALIRSFPHLRWTYAITKFCFALSLAIAVGLNPQKLFFLAIIVPVICLFFVMYGLINRWSLRSTGEPFVAALGNALALAWAIAVTFPIVS